MENVLNWVVTLLAFVLTIWPLLISVESVLRTHKWKWRISLFVLGLTLAVLTHIQQDKADDKLSAVKGQLDYSVGLLKGVAEKECDLSPGQLDTIRSFIATVSPKPAPPPVRPKPTTEIPNPALVSPLVQVSTPELIARVATVSKRLRDLRGEKAGVQLDSELKKWAVHEQRNNDRNSVSDEEMRASDETWDRKISESNDKFDNQIQATFIEADQFRREMLRRLSPTKWTQEDRDKDKDQAFTGMDERAAADYLERLAKRI